MEPKIDNKSEYRLLVVFNVLAVVVMLYVFTAL